MRVLHLGLSTSQGGAAVAARRLHLGLLAHGAESQMLVAEDPLQTPGTNVLSAPYKQFLWQKLDRLKIRRVGGLGGLPMQAGYGWLKKLPDDVAADVVHVHWLGGGFADLRLLKNLNVPVVWTLHDLWPLTGGCHHYALDCTRWQQACGACPYFTDQHAQDWTAQHWQDKATLYQDMTMLFIAPSQWVASHAQESGLLEGQQIATLGNTLDTNLFSPGDAKTARQALGLPLDKKLFLFCAYDAYRNPYKGFADLAQVMPALREDTGLVVVGNLPETTPAPLPCPVYERGAVSETDMPALYRAADAVVIPSHRETFCQVAVEAQACGTPVVAYAAGGLMDTVCTDLGSVLVPPGDRQALQEAVRTVLIAPTEIPLGQQRWQWVKDTFGNAAIAQAHLDLYRTVLDRSVDRP